ncbi:MAG: 1-deoxy-D-xylulose-5-phosphate synthase, partial [Desulfuromonadales bacterium]|nr:1-deoxy-D-xylulose-5-phosphate synthase [Desulfuromonadales bacterium]
YSTFMQRAYDQLLHDVCLQNLSVTFALDRGGLVGADGPTHHGVFDLSFMRHIPNLVFAVPRNEVELRRIMKAASLFDGPFAYRYPRGNGAGLPLDGAIEPLEIGQGELLRKGSDVLIIAVGVLVGEALEAAKLLSEQGIEVAVVDARFVKPLDCELILSQAAKVPLVVTAEENVLQGGFGAAVLELLSDAGLSVPIRRIGIPDEFVEQGTQAELRAMLGIDAEGMVATIHQDLKKNRLVAAIG